DFGGGTLPQSGPMDIFVAKLDPSGSHLWSIGFGGLSSDGQIKQPGDIATAVAAMPGGGAVVTGYFSDVIELGGGLLFSAGITDVFVGVFDAKGSHVHSAAFGG